MKKKFIITAVLLPMIACLFSCTEDWKDEQYEQTVSFKTSPTTLGVTDIYLRYKSGGEVTYELPLIVSGSTDNKSNLSVQIGIDSDTLATLNVEKYGKRTELYFEQLPEKYYSFPKSVTIQKGTSEALLPITFNFDGIDLAEKYVLPLVILDSPDGNYKVNNHKYYKRALLHIIPFNDFSGVYSGTNLIGSISDESHNSLTQSEYRAYVVNDSTVFFYAGLRDEDFVDRRNYKVFLKFTNKKYRVNQYYCEMYAENPDMNLVVNSQPKYKIESEMDVTKTYLKHIYITISDIDYSFTDFTTIPNYQLSYHMTGSLALQRNLNTLIPDQDQGIEW